MSCVVFNSITKAIISSPLTDELYDDLLEQLILADVGYEVSEYLCEELRTEARKRKAKTGQDLVAIFQDIVVDLLSTDKEFNITGVKKDATLDMWVLEMREC